MLRLEYHRLRLNREKKRRRLEGGDGWEKKGERKKGEKKRRNLESDRARGVVISVQIARVRIRHGVWKRRGTVDKPWLDFGSRSRAPATDTREREERGDGRKRKERRNEVVLRWKKYKKKKNDRVNKDRPVSHARDHCYYISRGVLFPWENWTGPFYHL